MMFTYMQAPTLLGVGRITVKLELPAAGGLYRFRNVTYRGVQVGKVTEIDVTRSQAHGHADPRHDAQDPRRPGGRGSQCLGGRRTVRRPATPQRVAAVPARRIGDRHGRHQDPAAGRPDAGQVNALVGSIPKDKLNGLLDESSAFNGAGYDLGRCSTPRPRSRVTSTGQPTAQRRLIEDTPPLLDSQAETTDASDVGAQPGRHHRPAGDERPAGAHPAATGPGCRQRGFAAAQPGQADPAGAAGQPHHIRPGRGDLPSITRTALVLLPPFVANCCPRLRRTTRPESRWATSAFRSPTRIACTVGFLPPSQWRSPRRLPRSTRPTGCTASCRRIRRSPCAAPATSRAWVCPASARRRCEKCDSDKPYKPLAMRQHALGPYPFDPNLIAQGIPPDDRVTANENIFAPVEGTPPPAWGGYSTPPAPGPPGAPAALPPGIPPMPGLSPIPAQAAPPPTVDTPGAVPAAPSSFDANASEPGPSVAIAHYDPQTGQYATPDGPSPSRPTSSTRRSRGRT